MARYGVDDVVTFRPRVTGGHVVAVVTGVHNSLVGPAYNIRITDGTRVWPTGANECISEDVLD